MMVIKKFIKELTKRHGVALSAPPDTEVSGLAYKVPSGLRPKQMVSYSCMISFSIVYIGLAVQRLFGTLAAVCC